MLIDEYLRQYNDFSPMEYYSLDATEKIEEIMRIDLIRNKEIFDFVNQ